MSVLLGIILAAIVLTAIYAVPLTWVAMLFLGNIGYNIGFWALLPGVIAAKGLLSGVTASSDSK